MVDCRGDLVDVGRADFIDDDGWRTTARYADKAVRVREEWEDAGGWRGWLDRNGDWSGQSTLEGLPAG